MNTVARFVRNFFVAQVFVLGPFASNAFGDDTEIFFNIEQDVSAPNILFVLDNSGSMRTRVETEYDSSIDYSGRFSSNYWNWFYFHREGDTRLNIMKDVAKNLADSLEGVNIGLMAFDKHARDLGEGGVILEPVRPIAENREDFKSAVDSLGPDTNTPLAETLFGAKRYFEGKSPFLSPAYRQADSALSGSRYKSPIDLECQANYVVLLTDGEPTRDTNHNTDMGREIGEYCSGNCLDEIAGAMYDGDLRSDMPGSQQVTTHTVGFTDDFPLLKDAAAKGNGGYYQANNAEELTAVFDAIFREVLSTTTTFTGAGVSVSNFNQLQYLNSVYFALFEPDTDPLWPGNLKRYKFNEDLEIIDANGNLAIDSASGNFKDSAQSYWSSTVDGANAGKGGVADGLTSSRKVYTYTSDSDKPLLSHQDNRVSIDNIDNLPKELFGDANMNDEDHQNLIRWTRGEDVFDEDNDGNRDDPRKFLGDPLHSKPHLQIYGGDEDSPDAAVFYGDNQGFIHAVDASSGQLYFSFIPEELLGNQAQYMNGITDTGRPYGMDGSVVAWFNDKNNDREVNDSDTVYIYSGMRRGGRNYYALDVTERDYPSMLWSIKGGEGDFLELGQTWSDPVKSRVRLDDEVRDVLFFSGGYDTNQDAVDERSVDSVGRAVYMVDASSGALLWWAGGDESGANIEIEKMEYSIPATPAVVDVNGNGLVDQLYVGDMGGQILRFDFNHGASADSFASGGVIASLGSSGEVGNRRFYHTPDISGTLKNGTRYINLAIGSGYQAHPLDKTNEDRFYKLTISAVDAPVNASGDTEYGTLTESDLMDVTDNLIQEGTEEEVELAETSLADSKGWFIRLTRAGEKVLAASTTLRGDVYFTTFEPSGSLDPCVPAAGQARMYHVSLRDGRAVVNYDGVGTDESLTESDRYINLKTLGIPPTPQVITIDGVTRIITGTETFEPSPRDGLVQKIYWFEE